MMVMSIQHRFFFIFHFTDSFFYQGYTPLEKPPFLLYRWVREKRQAEEWEERVFVFDILYLHDPLVPESDADKQCFIHRRKKIYFEEGKDDGESW